jgi:hypothetical protein
MVRRVLCLDTPLRGAGDWRLPDDAAEVFICVYTARVSISTADSKELSADMVGTEPRNILLGEAPLDFVRDAAEVGMALVLRSRPPPR